MVFGMSKNVAMAWLTALYKQTLRLVACCGTGSCWRVPLAIETAGCISHLKLPHYVDFEPSSSQTSATGGAACLPRRVTKRMIRAYLKAVAIPSSIRCRLAGADADAMQR